MVKSKIMTMFRFMMNSVYTCKWTAQSVDSRTIASRLWLGGGQMAPSWSFAPAQRRRPMTQEHIKIYYQQVSPWLSYDSHVITDLKAEGLLSEYLDPSDMCHVLNLHWFISTERVFSSTIFAILYHDLVTDKW